VTRLIREPLLHFLLLGALIFAVFSFVSGRDEPPRDSIVVPAGKVEHLAALFERTWQRPPTRVELEGLVRDFVREETAYREGMAAGLDRDDTIIRRRLRQKLEFLAEDFASRREPTDQELSTYLAEHADAFLVEPAIAFRQVFLDPERHGDALEARARELLVTLNADLAQDPATLGDRILLEPGYADVSTRDITDLFGSGFAADVAELPPGGWHGPIASAYGIHLVRVDSRTESRIPELDEIRGPVRREWENERREKGLEDFYAKLIARYDVRIEWPDSAARDEGS